MTKKSNQKKNPQQDQQKQQNPKPKFDKNNGDDNVNNGTRGSNRKGNDVVTKNTKNNTSYSHNNRNNNNRNNNKTSEETVNNKNKNSSIKLPYPLHWESYDKCYTQYNLTTKETIQKQFVYLLQQPATSTNGTSDVRGDTVVPWQNDHGNSNNVVRGKLKVMPGNDKLTTSFIQCDRGYILMDIVIPTLYERNRSMDGDTVFIELLGIVNTTGTTTKNNDEEDAGDIILLHQNSGVTNTNPSNKNTILDQDEDIEETLFWQDDDKQMDLWNPIVPMERRQEQPPIVIDNGNADQNSNSVLPEQQQPQWYGRVIYVVPPKIGLESEISSSASTIQQENRKNPCRTIVGTLHPLPSGDVYLLNPNNKSLPQFKLMMNNNDDTISNQIQLLLQQTNDEQVKKQNRQKQIKQQEQLDNMESDSNNVKETNSNDSDWEDINDEDEEMIDEDNDNSLAKECTTGIGSIQLNQIIVQAQYEYGTWKETHQWPPCSNLKYLGQSCVLEDEISALLIQHNINHTEQHSAAVLHDCNTVVESGLFIECNNDENKNNNQTSINWKPTSEMLLGRRDYRNERIFTIDPTTAKDLDDALHIKQISENVVEIGVHIADVSYFVDTHKTPALDAEACNRSTTVYLVDRTIPMLPRPLCEIACSLNENVERLAFSCVWRMNIDGTVRMKPNDDKKKNAEESGPNGNIQDVWYGRTVIKSCARLDYLTAQNIIDNKIVAEHNNDTVDIDSEVGLELWPKSRRPAVGSIHTMDQIASDVRLMHRVAMARRSLRFHSGALELSTTKLTFKLDPNNNTDVPMFAAPYPIRDSNKLIEEYMLLANYLVAQRLILYCNDRACLRHHPEPLKMGLGQVKVIAKAAVNFDLDISSSQSLQQSLWNLSQQCLSEKDVNIHDDVDNSYTNNNNDGIDHSKIILQCITQLLMTPMRPAEYIAAGYVPRKEWKHFALNIPYYTHFTSPIRRYPDIIVHRLLQESIDYEQQQTLIQRGSGGRDGQPENTTIDAIWDAQKINSVCQHCNDRRMDSKNAQERCDRIFLALLVRSKPITSQLGIVLSVGVSTFTVFVPYLGFDAKLYLQEHNDQLTWTSTSRSTDCNNGNSNNANTTALSGQRALTLQQRPFSDANSSGVVNSDSIRWDSMKIQVFTKLMVSVICKDTPPIDVKLRFEGPWIE